MRIKRALTVSDIISYRGDTLDFTGKWLESFGRPELKGSWIAWANSTNGKTDFAIQLAKYFATFKRVAYDSLEEGLSETIKNAIVRHNMKEVQRRFNLLDKEPISELKDRLRRRKSPDIIFIDSLQYTGLTYKEYCRLMDEFTHKLFVWISHAEGRAPHGNVAKSIKYDSNVKIYIEGYKAFPESRYGGGEPFTIWPKGAAEYWDYK
jgi:hypothetical protein